MTVKHLLCGRATKWGILSTTSARNLRRVHKQTSHLCLIKLKNIMFSTLFMWGPSITKEVNFAADFPNSCKNFKNQFCFVRTNIWKGSPSIRNSAAFYSRGFWTGKKPNFRSEYLDCHIMMKSLIEIEASSKHYGTDRTRKLPRLLQQHLFSQYVFEPILLNGLSIRIVFFLTRGILCQRLFYRPSKYHRSCSTIMSKSL